MQAMLVGRPKAWEFDKPYTIEQKFEYRKNQRETILRAFRQYNKTAPLVQNLDFGHSDPQIAFPYGKKVRVDSNSQKIFVEF